MELLTTLLGQPQSTAPKSTIVFFGATGDLVTEHGVRKALGDLVENGDLVESHHRLLFTSRRTVPAGEYLEDLKRGDSVEEPLSDAAIRHLQILSGLNHEGATLIPVDFQQDDPLAALPEFADDEVVLYYGALPPNVFDRLIEILSNSGALHEKRNRRLVLEKPFGQHLPAANVLAQKVANNFAAEQVYLVDHFLAYPGMLEWLSLRSKPSIELALSTKHLCPDRGIHIVLNEKLLSNDRAYFRETGILEDMLQNHAMQILANSCMDLSGSENADRWREHRLRVVEALRWTEGDASRAQVEGFNDPEHGAPKGADPSSVETFASLGFTLDLERFRDIPFRMTAAKGVDETRFGLEIAIRTLPLELADELGLAADQEATLEVDVHGGHFQLRVQGETYPLSPPLSQPNRPAYSRVFLDALHGEQAFFVAPAESVAAWQFVDRVQTFWKTQEGDLKTYPQGSSISALVP